MNCKGSRPGSLKATAFLPKAISEASGKVSRHTEGRGTTSGGHKGRFWCSWHLIYLSIWFYLGFKWFKCFFWHVFGFVWRFFTANNCAWWVWNPLAKKSSTEIVVSKGTWTEQTCHRSMKTPTKKHSNIMQHTYSHKHTSEDNPCRPGIFTSWECQEGPLTGATRERKKPGACSQPPWAWQRKGKWKMAKPQSLEHESKRSVFAVPRCFLRPAKGEEMQTLGVWYRTHTHTYGFIYSINIYSRMKKEHKGGNMLLPHAPFANQALFSTCTFFFIP